MAKAPDVTKMKSNVYKVLMENEHVRVLDIRLRPGEKAPMHNHPSKHIVYMLTDAKLKLTGEDGKVSTLDAKAGDTMWMEAGSHAAENVGTTEGHNLVIEVKG